MDIAISVLSKTMENQDLLIVLIYLYKWFYVGVTGNALWVISTWNGYIQYIVVEFSGASRLKEAIDLPCSVWGW